MTFRLLANHHGHARGAAAIAHAQPVLGFRSCCCCCSLPARYEMDRTTTCLADARPWASRDVDNVGLVEGEIIPTKRPDTESDKEGDEMRCMVKIGPSLLQPAPAPAISYHWATRPAAGAVSVVAVLRRARDTSPAQRPPAHCGAHFCQCSGLAGCCYCSCYCCCTMTDPVPVWATVASGATAVTSSDQHGRGHLCFRHIFASRALLGRWRAGPFTLRFFFAFWALDTQPTLVHGVVCWSGRRGCTQEPEPQETGVSSDTPPQWRCWRIGRVALQIQGQHFMVAGTGGMRRTTTKREGEEGRGDYPAHCGLKGARM